MLSSLSRGTLLVSLSLTWFAAAWLICDVIFADPAVLVFEDVAILCAALAPLTYLFGWGLRRLGQRFGRTATLRRA